MAQITDDYGTKYEFDERTAYDRLCEIYNLVFVPTTKLRPEYPICNISSPKESLKSVSFSLGFASYAAKQPYPPAKAIADVFKLETEEYFLSILIERSVSQELTNQVNSSQAQTALTLKAALAGAYVWVPKPEGLDD